MIDSFRRFRTGHSKPTPMRRPQFPAPQRYSLLASTQPFRKSAPREHVTGAIRLVFAKFRELGRCAAGLFVAAVSGHQDAALLRNASSSGKSQPITASCRLFTIRCTLGAYAFGRRVQRTRIVDGRARKVSGFAKPRGECNVLLRDERIGFQRREGTAEKKNSGASTP
jgi:hypothetical protein